MKLINKISYLHIINTVAVFIAGLFIIYFAVNHTIFSEMKSQLYDLLEGTEINIKNGNLADNPPITEISQVAKMFSARAVIKDTSIYMKGDRDYDDFREISAVREINGKYYKITARVSLVEKDDLFRAILLSIASIIALLLVALFIVNRKSAKKIFDPFYSNLKKLESFSLSENKALELKESEIEEFIVLNKSLLTLSAKTLKEFNLMKEFTEDLCHELQTPLSVIKAKLELILQKEIKDEEITEYIKSAYQNCARLEKLNRSLILLAKLETRELYPQETINIAEHVEKIAGEYKEIAQLKGINLEMDLSPWFKLEMNGNLFDIIIGNLISNSVKHNIKKGKIVINLADNNLVIKNTGYRPEQAPENYFNRFSSGGKTGSSLGLGLAITKKICDMYNLKLNYVYEEPYHVITVNFKQ